MKSLVILLLIFMAAQASNVQLYEQRPYSQEEVSLLNWFELTILRNELFAMQGYVFSTEWLAAYFGSQDWYSPSPGFITATEFHAEFTNEQQANIDLFLATAEGLEESITGCCYSDVQDLEVKYYKDLTFRTELPPLPDYYDNYTSVDADLGVHPDFSDENLLPFGIFNDFYTGCGDELTVEQLELIEDSGVHDRTVYRAYFRPDRTLAKIEKVTLMYMEVMGSRDPYTLWSAYYSANSMFMIFEPSCRMDWATRDLVLIYTCTGEECTLRAAFKGTCPTLTLEIYEGPYSDLPLSIVINNEDIGGYERYEELFVDRY